MISCSICEEEISSDQETAYAGGKLIHLDCLDEYEGDLEDIL